MFSFLILFIFSFVLSTCGTAICCWAYVSKLTRGRRYRWPTTANCGTWQRSAWIDASRRRRGLTWRLKKTDWFVVLRPTVVGPSKKSNLCGPRWDDDTSTKPRSCLCIKLTLHRLLMIIYIYIANVKMHGWILIRTLHFFFWGFISHYIKVYRWFFLFCFDFLIKLLFFFGSYLNKRSKSPSLLLWSDRSLNLEILPFQFHSGFDFCSMHELWVVWDHILVEFNNLVVNNWSRPSGWVDNV